MFNKNLRERNIELETLIATKREIISKMQETVTKYVLSDYDKFREYCDTYWNFYGSGSRYFYGLEQYVKNLEKAELEKAEREKIEKIVLDLLARQKKK